MAAMTLRGIDDHLARILKERAAKDIGVRNMCLISGGSFSAGMME
jgi:hypothetical protein